MVAASRWQPFQLLSVERIKGIEAGTGGGRPSSSQPQSQSIAASLTRKQRQRHTKKDDSAVLGALKRNQTSKWTQEGGRVATNPPASLTEASAIRAGTTSDLPADWQPIEIESKQTEQHTKKKNNVRDGRMARRRPLIPSFKTRSGRARREQNLRPESWTRNTAGGGGGSAPAERHSGRHGVRAKRLPSEQAEAMSTMPPTRVPTIFGFWLRQTKNMPRPCFSRAYSTGGAAAATGGGGAGPAAGPEFPSEKKRSHLK